MKKALNSAADPISVDPPFARRDTEIPVEPSDALTPAFAADDTERQQWRGFVSNVAFDPGSLVSVLAVLSGLLMPHASTVHRLRRA